MTKKILPTTNLDLFIKNRFKTRDEVHFIYALIPAYLTIIVTLILPFFQKEDKTELINFERRLQLIEKQLSGINDEVSDIKALGVEYYQLYDDINYMNRLIESINYI